MKMNNALRFALLLLIVLIWLPEASAQTQETFQRQPSIELPAELDRVLRDYERAWAAGDAAKLASLFTNQGYVTSSLGWIKGWEAIENQYEGASGDLRLRAISYSVEGSMGYVVGAYGYGEEFLTSDRGNFILILQRDPTGKWLIVADLDKSNQR